MTPFAWFGVVLRSLGAWQLLVAMELYVECFNMARGLYRPVLSDLMGYFNLGLIHTIAGLVLLFFAPSLARSAYPLKGSQRDEVPSAEHGAE
jgi:hypothetical protein